MDETVQEILNKIDMWHCDYELLQHDPVFTMEDVERVINIPLSARVKTMVIALSVDNKIVPILCGVSANAKVDLKKMTRILGASRSRVNIMNPVDAENSLGMPRGAIGLVAPYRNPITYLSECFRGMKYLFFGIGRNDRTLKIDTLSLVESAGIIFADIEKN